jgi:hypothetical protein
MLPLPLHFHLACEPQVQSAARETTQIWISPPTPHVTTSQATTEDWPWLHLIDIWVCVSFSLLLIPDVLPYSLQVARHDQEHDILCLIPLCVLNPLCSPNIRKHTTKLPKVTVMNELWKEAGTTTSFFSERMTSPTSRYHNVGLI